MNVNKQLTLRGIGMPVVDARGSGSAITLAADGIILEGFTATGVASYPEAGIKSFQITTRSELTMPTQTVLESSSILPTSIT